MQKNDEVVNYIRHLLGISEKFIDDDRLGPLHVSLYYAVFQSWNLAKFRNPISVSRDELMRASKIGSANTYTKCLKELDSWGYIKYHPSFNPHKGSQIYLYTFNKTTNNGSDIPNNKTTKKALGKAAVKAVVPYTNSINNKNKSNKKRENEHTQKKSNRKFSSSSARGTNPGTKKTKKVPRRQKTPLSLGRRVEGEVPNLTQIQSYFTSKNWSPLEAEKFFHHYESNGWLVAGKTPMKNWKASAAKWMLNAKTFLPSPRSLSLSKGSKCGDGVKKKSGVQRLHSNQNKNYGEPL